VTPSAHDDPGMQEPPCSQVSGGEEQLSVQAMVPAALQAQVVEHPPSGTIVPQPLPGRHGAPCEQRSVVPDDDPEDPDEELESPVGQVNCRRHWLFERT
jgi:hypothetical protein